MVKAFGKKTLKKDRVIVMLVSMSGIENMAMENSTGNQVISTRETTLTMNVMVTEKCFLQMEPYTRVSGSVVSRVVEAP